MNADDLIEKYSLSFSPLAGDAPVLVAQVDAQDWLRVAQAVRSEKGLLVALWGHNPVSDRYIVSASYCIEDKLLWLRLPVSGQAGYPDLSGIFHSATRMQRALSDLLGVHAVDAGDSRPWPSQGRWPTDYFPLRQKFTGLEQLDAVPEAYPFVKVQGDGIHEIAVGPIHAGIIEPGHFRFSIVGEKVVRLEELLGYTHKGVEKRFAQLDVLDGYRLAGRISGDSTVAYSWAYCMAVESTMPCRIPPRAQWLRALMLERERVASHMGDLGAIANDGGFAFGLSQFMLLREDWLRLNARLFGHRLMMDRIVPGGVKIDVDEEGIDLILAQCRRIEAEVTTLRSIYDDHAGLQDRFVSTGYMQPALAAELGVYGLAGRASDQRWDARVLHVSPDSAYARLNVRMALHQVGDVAARVFVRFEEVFESIRLLREIVSRLPTGEVAMALEPRQGPSMGAGWVEGWRGPIFAALEYDGDGKIVSCHCHDPSWQNWPALEHAILGNIVPDFPLINKSFNLSYSGQDL